MKPLKLKRSQRVLSLVFAAAALASAVTGLGNAAHAAPGLIPNNLSHYPQWMLQTLHAKYPRLKSSTASSLEMTQVQELDGYVAVKFQQSKNGVAVIGGGLTRISKVNAQAPSLFQALSNNSAALFSPSAQVENFQQNVTASSIATLSVKEASDLALAGTRIRSLDSKPELVYWNGQLAYSVGILSDEFLGGSADILIDAQTGKEIVALPHAISVSIDVRSAKNQEYVLTDADKEAIEKDEIPEAVAAACQIYSAAPVEGKSASPIAVLPGNCAAVFSDSKAVSTASREAQEALHNSQAVSEYFLSVHRRDSFDGMGTKIVNVVHLGRKFANAFWSPRQKIMAYGDGDGVEIGPLTRSLDVSGHEQTHGVVTSSGNLLGIGETGAVNEATADFFGKMIARRSENDQEWSIGRKVMLDGSRGIRDIGNPGSMLVGARFPGRGYPAKYSERFTAPTVDECNKQDGCFVHLNSTIFSHAMYNVFQALGQAKAEKLLYHTLMISFTPTTDLRGAGRAVRASCTRTLSESDCSLVDDALATSEI